MPVEIISLLYIIFVYGGLFAFSYYLCKIGGPPKREPDKPIVTAPPNPVVTSSAATVSSTVYITPSPTRTPDPTPTINDYK